MASLCGRQLSPADRRVWKQAIALLVGLKRRNGLGEEELAAAVGTAVRRGAAKRYCDDCGVKVAGGAAINSWGRGAPRSPWAGAPYTRLAPDIHRISREVYDVNEI
jgi:hypothetical protein